MSGFLYFIPGTANATTFARLGLDDRFGPSRSQTRVNANGSPNGAPGVVFHEPTPAGLPRPIEWHEAAGGKYWVGWHRGNAPKPAELYNGIGCDHRPVILRDGNEWGVVERVLPCRDLDPYRACGLPGLIPFADGEPSNPYAEFRPLIALAEQALPSFLDDSIPPPSNTDRLRFCAAVLGVRYRIGLEEMLALGLIGDEEYVAIVHIALDSTERMRAALADEGDELLDAFDRTGLDAFTLTEAAANG